MAQNIIPEKKKRKNIIMRVCIFLFVAWAAVQLVDMQVNLMDRKQEAVVLAERLEVQRIANKELERQLAAKVDDEYIERVARDQLDYVYPEERVYINISGS